MLIHSQKVLYILIGEIGGTVEEDSAALIKVLRLLLDSNEILAERRRFVNSTVFHLYSKPLTLVEGKMQYLTKVTGDISMRLEGLPQLVADTPMLK